MQQIIALVMPVFGLVALGWLVAHFRVLPESTGVGISDFVATLAIPALIFRTLSEGDIPQASPWMYWLAYFLGVAIVWGIAMMVGRRGFGADGSEAVIYGFASAQSNTVQLGVPLIVMVFGEAGAVPMFLLIAVHLPVIMIIAVLLLGRARGEKGWKGLLAAMRALAINPIVLAIAFGGLVRILHLPLPVLAQEIIGQVASSAAPVALLAMGMSVARYGLRANLGPTLAVTFLKMMVHPFIVWVLAFHMLPVPPVYAAVAVTFAALPSGVNAYLIAVRYRAAEALASNSVSVTTFFSAVTLTFWLWLIGAVPPA